jgi:hypothetical protein
MDAQHPTLAAGISAVRSAPYPNVTGRNAHIAAARSDLDEDSHCRAKKYTPTVPNKQNIEHIRRASTS